MNNYTQDLMKQVELADDDKYDTDYNTKVFAKSVLSLLPDEVIQYAIYETYRLGRKPGSHHYRKLNAFRKSEMASTLYYLWRGKEYTPEVQMKPKRKPYHYNSPCITIVDGELEIAITESFMVDNPEVASSIW